MATTFKAATIAAAVRRHGTGSRAIDIIRQTTGVTEAQALEVAQKITEAVSTGQSAPVTAPAATDAYDAHQRRRLDQLAADAAAAAAKPIGNCSIAELTALAAASGGVFGDR